MNKFSYKLNVGYYDFYDLTSPFINVTINYKGCNIKWDIYDIHGNDLETWMNIRKSMLDTTGNPVNFGGGGNSSWYCWCKEGLFELHYIISGMGGDSNLTISIPCEEMIDCVNAIIDVLECASKNIKYIPK